MADDHSMIDDMDELFGDGDDNTGGLDTGLTDALNTGLTDGLNDGLGALTLPLDSDALLQRVESSHIIGCQQKLAWSTNGSVARISPDGRQITTRAIVRDSETGAWSLSDESPQPVVAQRDSVFVHVEWSASGYELVATDLSGQILIFTMAYALNRLNPSPLNYSPLPDDLNVVVGLQWLAPHASSRGVPLISPATRNGDRWFTQIQLHETTAVSHPFDNRAAFMCVTRNVIVKLIYQQPNALWLETELELGSLVSYGDIITHAAFGDSSNHLLLVTYDMSKCLRLYRIGINWHAVGGDAQHPPSVNPQLSLKHVQILDRCIPQSHDRPFSDSTPNLMPTSLAGAELSNIQIRPPMSGSNGSFTVMALYTSAGSDDQLSHGSKFSVIARWELQQSDVTLHESFVNLKPSTEKPATKTILRRLDDIISPKIILSATSNIYNSIIAFAASDGTVEFRSRDTMEIIVANGDNTKASSLAQSGFTFLPSECIDIALSPAGCMAAIVRPDQTVHLHTAEYLHGWSDAKVDDYLAQAAIVSLVREVGILTVHQKGTDDALAMIPPDLDEGLRRKFISELFRTVSRNTDFSQEESTKQGGKVMKDPILFKILSMVMVLGYKDNPSQRDIPAKVVWVMMNLRVVGTSVASSMASNAPQPPEIHLSLRGSIKWTIDLMTSILADLFTIARTTKTPIVTSSIQSTVNTLNTPSLHILLHSAPRALLRLVTEILKPYQAKVTHPRTIQLAQTPAERAALEDTGDLLTTSLPFKHLKVLETLISEIDGAVRKAYADANATAQMRSQAEQALLVEGTIPSAFESVLKHLFEVVVPKMGEAVDGARVFYRETGWLGLGDRRKDGLGVDVVRKTEVPRGRKVRVCRRCGGVTEDAWEGAPPWVLASQKACLCGGFWVVV